MSERLEGIKEDVGTNAIKEHEFITTILYEDALWLIEQAERVQEFKKWWQDEARYNNVLTEQNKRYREALEFYANDITWEIDETHYSDADKYKGEIARKALDESK